jgi:UDP-N-acetyl-D-galactosamine dehydrogenase
MARARVVVADPIASPAEVRAESGLELTDPVVGAYDLVIGAVAHRQYKDFSEGELGRLVSRGGTLADLKGIWRSRDLPAEISRWTL